MITEIAADETGMYLNIWKDDKSYSFLVEDVLEAAEELAEIKASYKRVMDEKCAPDEQHCTCVPALRARIKELESERNRIAAVT